MRINSTKLFIQKAKEIHKDKYDYSLVEYKKSLENVKIICYEHGIFEQTPNNHLSGQGCKECHFKKIKSSYRSNTEDFISKAKETHKDNYDYSLVEYTKNSTKVIIICPIHGQFEQSPNNHLSGFGCKKCALDEQVLKQSSNTEVFISKAIELNGNRFNYSMVNYINNTTKVKIICSIHGEFMQSPNNHLRGQGCFLCNLSKGELVVEQWLTDNNIIFEREKRFSDCKNKRCLPFDFYLPDYNMCIEYDGVQHFKPQSFGTNKDENWKLYKYNQVKTNDKIKNEYCINNKINLIRIPYFSFNKIENILKAKLK